MLSTVCVLVFALAGCFATGVIGGCLRTYGVDIAALRKQHSSLNARTPMTSWRILADEADLKGAVRCRREREARWCPQLPWQPAPESLAA